MAAPDTFKQSNGPTLAFKLDADDVVRRGDLIIIPADGYAILGADAAAIMLAGPAMEDIDNTGGADGDKSVEVDIGGAVVLCTHTGGSQTVADIGDIVFVDGTNAVDDIGGVSNPVAAGVIVGVPSATTVWVQLFTPKESATFTALALADLTFGTNIAAATANGALTDSSATNPTDSQFNELAKELGTRLNAITAAFRA